MRSLALVAAAVLSSCTASRPTSVPVADLATPLHDWGTVACPESLDAYCATASCNRELSTAPEAWCGNGLPGAVSGTCAGYVYVRQVWIDAGTTWIYDAATGTLVAVLWFANVDGGCSGGPGQLELRACSEGSGLCAVSDAG